MVHDTEDKSWWLKKGERDEVRFVGWLSRRGIKARINPAKGDDPTSYDLVMTNSRGVDVAADLKTVETPFFLAGRYGFDPARCVTFNEKDYQRYCDRYSGLNGGSGISVIFWVSWGAQERFGVSVPGLSGVWYASIFQIRDIIQSGGAGYHE